MSPACARSLGEKMDIERMRFLIDRFFGIYIYIYIHLSLSLSLYSSFAHSFFLFSRILFFFYISQSPGTRVRINSIIRPWRVGERGPWDDEGEGGGLLIRSTGDYRRNFVMKRMERGKFRYLITSRLSCTPLLLLPPSRGKNSWTL